MMELFPGLLGSGGYEMELIMATGEDAGQSMLHKILTAARRDLKLLIPNGLLSLWFFLKSYQPVAYDPAYFSRQFGWACLLFVLLQVSAKLFNSSVRVHIAMEVAELGLDAPSRFLKLFVLYKEMIKTVIGVSMALAWMAGVVFILELFVESFILVPILVALLYSIVLIGCMRLFVAIMDNIRFP
jgi:hypothetical protein